MYKSLIVIDPKVAGYDQWLTGIDASDSDVFILNTQQDGLQQIADYLAASGKTYDALHIVSHGAEAALYLGSTTISTSNLDSYTTVLDQIGHSLTANGDILLYGCNVAAGTKGQQFIQRLASLTAADVAASTDVTGPASLSGNGILEAETGTIQTNALTMEKLTSVLSINNAPTFMVGDGIVTTPIGTGNDEAYGVTELADSKILVAGYTFNGSNMDFALVRYNSDGTLDTTFNTTGIVTTAIGIYQDYAYSVTVQADGKILVAGYADNGSNSDFALVRYSTDGTLDTTFNATGLVVTAIGTGYDYAKAVTLQADGKILVTGWTDNDSGLHIALVRYNTDGSLDTTFNSTGIVTTAIGAYGSWADSVIIQADGKILAAGNTWNGSNYDFALVRYNTDGTLDTTFNTTGIVTTAIGTGYDIAKAVTLQVDGKILMTGYAWNGSSTNFALVRYNTDGTPDTTFNTTGIVTTDIAGEANSITLQANGKILVAGRTFGGGNDDFALVRYNTDGTLDTTFNTTGRVITSIGTSNDIANSVTVQVDDKILVAGNTVNGSTYDFALVRYNTNGSLDPTFDSTNTLDGLPAFTEQGLPVVLDSNVKIYDAELSAFGNYGGASLTLARHGGTNAEDQFSSSGGVSVLIEGSNLVVAGSSIGTVTQNSNGQLVISFNGNASQVLVDQALQSLSYSNSSYNPPSTVQIDWTFNDGNSGAQGSGGAQSVTGSTTVNITAVNDAPQLTAAAATLADDTEDTAYTVSSLDLLQGWTDAEGDTLSVRNLAANHGAVLDNGNGAYTITPEANYNGAVELRYQVSDGTLATDASIGFTLAAVNDAPVAVADDALSATEDTPVTFAQALMLGNDTDADGDTLSIDSVQSITGGAFTLNGNGDVAFIPAANFNGPASFSYVAADGHGGFSNPMTVTVNVAAVDDDPTNILLAARTPIYGNAVQNSRMAIANLSVADAEVGEGNQYSYTLSGANAGLFSVADNKTLSLGKAPVQANTTVSFTLNATLHGDTISENYTYGNGTVSSGSSTGTDTVALGDSVNNIYYALGGHDTVTGGNLQDLLFGQDGNDILSGGAGNDDIQGGGGNDILIGGSGADVLTGGGKTTLGNGGYDQFCYMNKATDWAGMDGNGLDTILDFKGNATALKGTANIGLINGDVLAFNATDLGGTSGLISGTTSAGKWYTLAADGLVSGAGAVANANHAQFIYDKNTHILNFDADGTGSGSAVEITSLVGVDQLLNTHIVIQG